MTNLKIKCTRCNGSGLVGGPVVHLGVPGNCFRCGGTGEVYKDKFVREFGLGHEFFGMTYRNTKSIVTCTEKARLERDTIGGDEASFSRITEEQARKFFARYGKQTQV
jgi:hypothetical protein